MPLSDQSIRFKVLPLLFFLSQQWADAFITPAKYNLGPAIHFPNRNEAFLSPSPTTTERQTPSLLSLSYRTTQTYTENVPSSLPNSSDPYVLLNINYEATVPEIKRAYRMAALQYHPDVRIKATSSQQERLMANDDFARINGAYAILTGRDQQHVQTAQSKPPNKATVTNYNTGSVHPPKSPPTPPRSPPHQQTNHRYQTRRHAPSKPKEEEESSYAGYYGGTSKPDEVKTHVGSGRSFYTRHAQEPTNNSKRYTRARTRYGSAKNPTSAQNDHQPPPSPRPNTKQKSNYHNFGGTSSDAKKDDDYQKFGRYSRPTENKEGKKVWTTQASSETETNRQGPSSGDQHDRPSHPGQHNSWTSYYENKRNMRNNVRNNQAASAAAAAAAAVSERNNIPNVQQTARRQQTRTQSVQFHSGGIKNVDTRTNSPSSPFRDEVNNSVRTQSQTYTRSVHREASDQNEFVTEEAIPFYATNNRHVTSNRGKGADMPFYGTKQAKVTYKKETDAFEVNPNAFEVNNQTRQGRRVVQQTAHTDNHVSDLHNQHRQNRNVNARRRVAQQDVRIDTQGAKPRPSDINVIDPLQGRRVVQHGDTQFTGVNNQHPQHRNVDARRGQRVVQQNAHIATQVAGKGHRQSASDFHVTSSDNTGVEFTSRPNVKQPIYPKGKYGGTSSVNGSLSSREKNQQPFANNRRYGDFYDSNGFHEKWNSANHIGDQFESPGPQAVNVTQAQQNRDKDNSTPAEEMNALETLSDGFSMAMKSMTGIFTNDEQSKDIFVPAPAKGLQFSPFEACAIIHEHDQRPEMVKQKAVDIMLDNHYIPATNVQFYTVYRKYKNGQVNREQRWGECY
jgi:curved DNA-binding protein CbpA